MDGEKVQKVVEEYTQYLKESAALVKKLQEQNEYLTGEFEKAARGKEAAEELVNKQQDTLVRTYEELAKELQQRVDYERALKNIAAEIESMDESVGVYSEIMDELSVLTVYGNAIYVDKEDVPKSQLDLAKELIRDIQIEIMDGRLADWQKITRICTWCAEYDEQYSVSKGRTRLVPEREVDVLLDMEKARAELLIDTLKRLSKWKETTKDLRKEMDIALQKAAEIERKAYGDMINGKELQHDLKL